MDNAVTDAMLEGAEAGNDLPSRKYLLPVIGFVKAYSLLLNSFDRVVPVPEGMSVTAARKSQNYDAVHKALSVRLIVKARRFMKEQGYERPYWELVRLAREAKKGK